MGSSSVCSGRMTVLQACLRIMRHEKAALSPSEIAEKGVEKGILRVPRGRTFGYLSQLVQSTIYNNAMYSDRPSVSYYGKYKAKR